MKIKCKYKHLRKCRLTVLPKLQSAPYKCFLTKFSLMLKVGLFSFCKL